MPRRTPDQLRSARWFAPDDLRGFAHRSRLMQMGNAQEDWAGKPAIAIINAWSGIDPCHAHVRPRRM
jgi:dihydroxyacid dehydratase/phosphogluconate dehydratase